MRSPQHRRVRGRIPLLHGPQNCLGLEARAGFGLPAAGRREGAPRLWAGRACTEPHVVPTLQPPTPGLPEGLQGRPFRPKAFLQEVPSELALGREDW